jgi:hypothetical protein
MLDCAGLWKERKEWEEDGRNVELCRTVEGKKEMGRRLKEFWTVYDCGKQESNGRKMKGMLDGLWKCKEDGRNAGQCRIEEGKKGMGRKWKEFWTV